MIYLFFDTETTGLPANFGAPATDLGSWDSARLVQLGWILEDDRKGERAMTLRVLRILRILRLLAIRQKAVADPKEQQRKCRKHKGVKMKNGFGIIDPVGKRSRIGVVLLVKLLGKSRHPVSDGG